MKVKAPSIVQSLILLVLALFIGASGQSGAATTASAEPSCEVARGHGFVITGADVHALRAAMSPSPPFGAASRLALDAAVAQWLTEGHVVSMPAGEKLQRYRATVVDALAEGGADELARVFRDAREELRVELGPCYVEIESKRIDSDGNFK